VAEASHLLRLQHLSVTLPTELYKLLELEIASAEPEATFTVVTERFLLAAGAPPPDAASELAAFDAALPRPDEAMSAFAGRLAVLASCAFSTLDAAGRAMLVKRRFTSALATTHPSIYRALELQQPATVADAVKLATTHVRVDAMIAERTQVSGSQAPQVPTPPSTAASAPATTSASATSIAQPAQPVQPARSASTTSALNQRNVEELLGHMRALRFGNRGRARGPFRPSRGRRGMGPSFDNRPYSRADFGQYDRNSDRDRRDHNDNRDRRDYNRNSDNDRRFTRSSSAPPLQCFACNGLGHIARDCPNGSRPDRRF
jgi:hypothetical protein